MKVEDCNHDVLTICPIIQTATVRHIYICQCCKAKFMDLPHGRYMWHRSIRRRVISRIMSYDCDYEHPIALHEITDGEIKRLKKIFLAAQRRLWY